MQADSAAVCLRVVEQAPVPADCTMKGLEYMPLMVDRLRGSRSWLRCRRRPELGFYMMNLWSAAWRQTPAGSLEDDDGILADAAMCDPDRWDEVKGEVLHGWLRCSFDGRLYHPVVSEVASNVWESRAAYRRGTAKARQVKAAKRARDLSGRQPSLPEPIGSPPGRTSPVTQEEMEDCYGGPRSPDSFHDSGDNVDKPLSSLPEDDHVRSATELSQTFKSEVRSEKKEGEPPLPPRGATFDCSLAVGEEERRLVAKLGLDLEDTVGRFEAKYLGSRARSTDWPAKFRGFCYARENRTAKRSNPAAWMAPASRFAEVMAA